VSQSNGAEEVREVRKSIVLLAVFVVAAAAISVAVSGRTATAKAASSRTPHLA